MALSNLLLVTIFCVLAMSLFVGTKASERKDDLIVEVKDQARFALLLDYQLKCVETTMSAAKQICGSFWSADWQRNCLERQTERMAFTCHDSAKRLASLL